MQKSWIKRTLVGFTTLGILGAASVVAANAYIEWRAQDKIYALDDPALPSRSVAIVLGARVMPDGSPSPALEDRLAAALSLYERGKVKKILVTGDHGTRGYNEVAAMFKWLVRRGVSPEHVYLDHAGLRTLDSMARASSIFKIEDAIICTQAFHLPRSVFLAQEHDIEAVGVIADRRQYARRKADARREFVARAGAVADVYVLARSPKHSGEPIPITGPASASYDETARAILQTP